ncbi:WAS/WASL-interacting protein family member 1-like isoform X1 [Scylla paramamosain]|uniref:WAS/WASL-interacting protein family member 1-like isoform X1 n=1 Tax=Scylla paramamosain TaxID=85552 RepID=UPI003083A4AB
MMMSGGMPPTAGGMGVMGVMGGYLGGGREYLEGGGVGVDSSVWVPPFWEDPHLADAHLHDPSIAEAAHMGEPPSMGDVGGGDLMDAFPPHQQHEYMMSSDGVVVKEEENIKDDYFKYKDATYAKYVKDNDYLKEETPYLDGGGGGGGGGGGEGGRDSGGSGGVDGGPQITGGGPGVMGVNSSPTASLSPPGTTSSSGSSSSLHPPLTSPHVQQLSSLCPPFPEAQLTSLSSHKDDPDKKGGPGGDKSKGGDGPKPQDQEETQSALFAGPSERREALSNWLSPRLSISLHAAPVLSASLPVPLHGPDSGLPSDADLQPTNPKNLVIKRRAEKESAKEDDGRKRRKRRKLMYDTEKQKEK